MWDLPVILAVAATFLVAGTVKGVIGLGLPTVSLGLLTVVQDLPTAMALLVIPSFATNLWQASVGGNGWVILKRIWPFLVMATATVWIGALALTRLDLWFLSALLGILLLIYGGLNLAGIRLTIAASHEYWAGPVFGTANGILTGMTGSFVVPGVMFLQAIGLPRDMLVQAMGILFTLSTVALAMALQTNSLLPPSSLAVSAAAMVPAFLGVLAGQRVRQKLSEARFRQLFFVAIVLLGLYILGNAIAA